MPSPHLVAQIIFLKDILNLVPAGGRAQVENIFSKYYLRASEMPARETSPLDGLGPRGIRNIISGLASSTGNIFRFPPGPIPAGAGVRSQHRGDPWLVNSPRAGLGSLGLGRASSRRPGPAQRAGLAPLLALAPLPPGPAHLRGKFLGLARMRSFLAAASGPL
jgi:hypothetical protein